ncbi:MAG TPA: MotA/TolQ/ExbB proton channel family protein [candidate division Zixibacteria bacterium]|nr:MotA/TolQ/ExbB proton channel family protein [candidate division Zixibacteria bacterium]
MYTTTALALLAGSIWGIISETSTFGLIVLITLVFMSFVSWVIIFTKWRQYRDVERATDRFLKAFRQSNRIADALGQAKSSQVSPVAQVYINGFEEWTALASAKAGGALQEASTPLSDEDFEIVEMTMDRTATEAIGTLERRTVFLATTGNSAPFMGLLGTVVGIMDAFWSIGERGSASLAVVAPGIAEALLATIVGLGAAIPAVIAFNWANNKIKFSRDAAESFILEFLARARKENA